MLDWVHWAWVWAYALAPVVAVARSGVAPGPVRARRRRRVVGAFLIGMAIGVLLEMAYAAARVGEIRWGQAVLAGYFAMALVLILRGFDAVLRAVTWRIFGVGGEQGTPPAADAGSGNVSGGRAVSPRKGLRLGRQVMATVVRVLVLFAVGIPYVTAVGLTYRPKIGLTATPESQFGFAYENVSFESTDGVRLSGWWIPSGKENSRNARRTVLICHGLASNKAEQLLLARDLVPAGYNVLAFDFRAHGESGGQLTSFGARERYDVLGAVRWVRANRPEAAERIFGVGVSTGGAALIAAAAEDTEDGRAIAAVVVYGGFSNLKTLFGTMAGRVFAPPFDRYVVATGMPIASAHTGADLTHFVPGELADRLWPRPLLVIHGVGDAIVPWEEGEALYRAASPPKDYLWRERQGHFEPLADDGVSGYVRWFLDHAEPVPVI
jgi:fermentation-respiration switch protein FrsA (DUF1100 family)